MDAPWVRKKPHSFCGALLLATLAVLPAKSTLSAADEASLSRATAVDPVRQVLALEAAGEVHDRRAALEALPEKSAATDLFQWSVGRIKWLDNWVHFEAIVDDLDYQEKLREYRRMRDAATNKVKGEPPSVVHGRLAAWCRAQKLTDQEWLHWTKVLESDPNNVAVRTRLGDELIEGVWYSRNDIAAARQASIKMAEQLATWLPRLKLILNNHRAKDPAARAAVAGRLQELKNPDAVPAILAALYVADDVLARHLIELLAEIGTPDAAIVLAQVALSDTYGPLGQAAIDGLHGLPAEFYVPALLGMLSSPITHQLAIVEGSHGQLMLQQVLFRESQMHHNVQKLLKSIHFDSNEVHLRRGYTGSLELGRDQVVRGAFEVGEAALSRRKGRTDRAPSFEEKLARRKAQSKLQNEARLQNDQVEAANARTQDLNRKIYHILRATTDAQGGDGPNAWWQWWYERNELFFPQEQKQTQLSYQAQSEINRVTTYTQSATFDYRQWDRNQTSCLVAGTLVQTAEGLRPVDQIQPGDLVLSQHPETGELAYKPVLATTLRPPAPIVAIETEDNVIRATGGHLFWVPGKGWMRARMLTSDMVLHDVHGTTRIRSVTTESEKQPAYNLIVPDFHSYFVSSERVLSYDNTPLRPTAITVPGLTIDDAVKK